jgi:hypothetical protein
MQRLTELKLQNQQGQMLGPNSGKDDDNPLSDRASSGFGEMGAENYVKRTSDQHTFQIPREKLNALTTLTISNKQQSGGKALKFMGLTVGTKKFSKKAKEKMNAGKMEVV